MIRKKIKIRGTRTAIILKIQSLVFILLWLLIPSNASAVDQHIIDSLLIKLNFFEETSWETFEFDDQTLIEALEYIYAVALQGDDFPLQRKTLHAMGMTGLVEFTPTLINALNSEPFSACWALGKMPTEQAVDALISMLPNAVQRTRKAAIWALWDFPYYLDFPGTSSAALDALYARLEIEEDAFLLEQIQAAIYAIEQLPNEPPICNFIVETPMPYIGSTGEILFNATGTYDPDPSDILSYTWDFDGDCIFNDPYTGEPDTPAHTYTMSYFGPVMLLVNDGINECYYTQFVDVTIIE